MAETTATAPQPTGHPPVLWFIFWGEFAERCCYYGMRAILALYMTTRIGLPDETATAWYSWFKSACYLLPLLGGFLADRFFGKYWTIVGFSVPYVVGQFLLAFADQSSEMLGIANEAALIASLALLACGSGVIKPNISALLGLTYDQQRPGLTQLRALAFLWFYFSVNVGALISQLFLPMVRDEYGYRVAFLIPAVLMALALVVFAAGKKYYAVETVGPPPPMTPEQRAEQRKVLVRLFGVFALMVFFWVAYEHNDTLWVFFARDHMDRFLPGWLPSWLGAGRELAPDQFQFVNAGMVLVLVPFSQWFWPKVDPTGTRFPHTTKIFLGFLFTASAPATMAVAGYLAGDGRVTALWIVLAYILLTVGEVLVYGTGLDLSYAYAPKSMKGFVTACFLLTNSLGNMINSQFAPLYNTKKDLVVFWTKVGESDLNAWQFFAVDTGVVLAAAVVFLFVGRQFNRGRGAST